MGALRPAIDGYRKGTSPPRRHAPYPAVSARTHQWPENIAPVESGIGGPDENSAVKRIEAVWFDLDHTLCLSTQDDAAIHEAVFERVGVDPFFEPRDLYAVDFDAVPDPDSEREHYEGMYAAAADIAGADPAGEVLTALAEATLEVMDTDAVTFRPGAEEALAYAREEYTVGLLTAGTESTQTEKLDALGIREAFEATVFCGPGTGVETKPDPEPYELALSELDVAPERAVYVGDRLDGDVAGAHEAGMRSVWVPLDRPGSTPPERPDPEPTHRLESMTELPTVL